MSKINVFLSYSHKDKEIAPSIISRLKRESNIQLKYDEAMLTGQKLHREISKMINAAEIIIPFITDNWLESHECRDELVRANERRKAIIAIVRMPKNGNHRSELPHYISDDKQIRYCEPQEFEPALEALIKAILSQRSHSWKQSVYNHIRTIGDIVEKQEEDVYTYKQNYVDRLSHATLKEIREMLEGEFFQIELGVEKNFLTRATPIFQSSKEIYALSIADISNFWIDDKSSVHTSNYLQIQQDKKVVRLFVFSSPAQLNQYKNVLQANYDSYGCKADSSGSKSGGVFLTSKETYDAFLGDIKEEQFIKKIYDEDFGVLIFSNNLDDKKEYLLAKLNETSLHFKPFTPDVMSTSEMQFVFAMDELNLIDEGRFGSKFNILRWSPAFLNDSSKFETAMSTLFKNYESEVFHCVLIKGDKNVEETLFKLQQKFCENSKELKIKTVDLNKTEEVFAHDGNYGGPINTSGEYDFMLRIVFDNKAALKHYYAHPVHSLERELLYKAVNPQVLPLYEKLHSLKKIKTTPDAMATIYSEIEDLMKPFIFRYDSTLDNPISIIIQKPGVPIGKYKV